MKIRPLLTLLVLAAAAPAVASDEVPGAPATRPVALVGGTVYPVSGPAVEDGVVVVADGKIAAVGKRGDVDVPADAESVDCGGKRIYPGLFDASDQLGLVEIGAVRATVDDTETGGLNPNAQARVSVNPDSEVIPTVRANGILLANVTPTGGIVSGESATMMLDGWTYEDMTLKPVTGIRLNWPNLLPRESYRRFIPIERQLQVRDESLRAIEDVFDAAERYRVALDAAGVESAATRPAATTRAGKIATTAAATRPGMEVPDYDAKLEAMVPLLTGRVPLIVNADEQSQIESAVAFAARRKIKLIVLGAADAGKVIPLLKQHDVAVILEGTHRMPTARDEPYDEPFTLPARLAAAGVRFAVASNREPAFARNLPEQVGTAVGYGLDEADALKCMTLSPAQILGVADRVGSLEAGKDATLIVCDGDILETPTHVVAAYIQGRPVDLSSKQTKLYEKYKQRYGQK